MLMDACQNICKNTFIYLLSYPSHAYPILLNFVASKSQKYVNNSLLRTSRCIIVVVSHRINGSFSFLKKSNIIICSVI